MERDKRKTRLSSRVRNSRQTGSKNISPWLLIGQVDDNTSPLRSYLEDGDGTDGDQDNDSDVHFGGELSAVVGVVVLVVLLRMVQHVVVVSPGVLILHTHTHTHTLTFKVSFFMNWFHFLCI